MADPHEYQPVKEGQDGRIELHLIRGRTWRASFSVDRDLTGVTVSLKVKTNLYDADSSVILTASEENRVNGSSSSFDLVFAASSTAALDMNENNSRIQKIGYSDLEFTLSSGDIDTPVGDMIVYLWRGVS